MIDHLKAKNLAEAHTPRAIAKRLAATTRHSYLGDFVLGAIDGTVTTFAVVSGVAGAELSHTVALVLGVANLVADGFSMASGNYLSSKAERHVVEQVRRVEAHHIDEVPDGEREEVRQIFAAKGFQGDLLEQAVDVITEDRRRWIDTMVTEEFGMQLETPSPLRAAATTFLAFVVAGFVPLFPFCTMRAQEGNIFLTSAVATAGTFFLVGLIKGHVVGRSKIISGLETLLVGSAAAVFAYLAGAGLKGLLQL
jgi:VIT1/CCC1 family predicted Fe2+/Mn2+ transporter